ncbi:MAG: hypothetical protein RL757_1703 [Bacteroidota bacterium]
MNRFFGKYFFALLMFFLLQNLLTAQRNIEFRFSDVNDSLIFQQFGKNIEKKLKNQAEDSLSVVQILGGGLLEFQNLGFLETSLDSFSFEEKRVLVQLHIGKKYDWLELKNGNISEDWLSSVGFRPSFFESKAVQISALRDLQNRLLQFAENHGFPFASVFLDSVSIKNVKNEAKISANLVIKKGQFVSFEQLELVQPDSGKVNISEKFLIQYLDFKKGEPFSAERVRDISRRLGELVFLRELRPTTVSFTQVGAKLKLFLGEKKANVLDGIIGVLPNPNAAATGGRQFSIVATGNADFQNLLGRGEHLAAKLEQLRPQSPNLDTKIYYPYLFDLPFGIDFNFQLFKFDSTYLDTKLDLGVRYVLRGGDFVKVFWQNFTTSNLTLPTQNIISTRRLPTTLDITTQAFGIEFQRARLDYRFNPRRGFSIRTRMSGGARRVRKNTEILTLRDDTEPTFNFEKLYDSVSLKNFQYKLNFDIDFFLPLGKRSTLKMGVQNGLILGGASAARNELFRIGGNRLLRGFDEERIFTPIFSVATLEYRLLLARNSFLFAFLDGGFFENAPPPVSEPNFRRFDTPRSFGAGISFETGAGIVAINLAIGSSQKIPLDFRNVKTHFSYINLF